MTFLFPIIYSAALTYLVWKAFKVMSNGWSISETEKKPFNSSNFSQKKYSDIFYKYEYTFRITNGKLSFLSMFPRFVLEGLAIILLLTLSLVMIFQYNIDTDEMIIVLGTIVFASKELFPPLSIHALKRPSIGLPDGGP